MSNEYSVKIVLVNGGIIEGDILTHSLENGVFSFIRANRIRYLVPTTSILFIEFDTRLDDLLLAEAKKLNTTSAN